MTDDNAHHEQIHLSEKSYVALITRHGEKAILKKLLSTEPQWQQKFTHEINCYHYFEQNTPPVLTPRLYENTATTLTLSYIEGQPLNKQRHPADAPEIDHIEKLITTLQHLSCWTTDSRSPLQKWPYSEKAAQYEKAEFLTQKEADFIHTISQSSQFTPAHGDALFSNIILTHQDELVLIDWEFCGLYLPTYDLALVHTLLPLGSPARKIIEQAVQTREQQQYFTANKLLLCARELKIHNHLPQTHAVRSKLAEDKKTFSETWLIK